MSYRDDQRETRAALKPRMVEVHWGKTRRQKRSLQFLKDRNFTKPNFVKRVTDKDNTFIGHVVSDYRFQREGNRGI